MSQKSDDDDMQEEEKMKKELKDLDLFEDGMNKEHMKEILRMIRESLRTSQSPRRSASPEQAEEVKEILPSDPLEIPATSNMFDHLINSSDHSNDSISDKDTQILETSKESSPMPEGMKKCQKLHDLFKRLRAQNQEKQSPSPPLPKTEEEYQARLKEVTRCMDEASFYNKYRHKLEQGIDISETRWGSPIKLTSNLDDDDDPKEMAQNSPGMSAFMSLENSKDSMEVFPKRFSARTERIIKRKSNIAENSGREEYVDVFNFVDDDVEKDDNSDEEFLIPVKKKRGRGRGSAGTRGNASGTRGNTATRGKGRGNKAAQNLKSLEKPFKPVKPGTKMLYSEQAVQNMLFDWNDDDEAEEENERKALQHEMEIQKPEIPNGMGKSPGRREQKKNFQDRMNYAQLILKAAQNDEEQKNKEARKAEEENEIKENSKRLEIAHKRRAQENENRQKEFEEEERRKNDEKKWSNIFNDRGKSYLNKESMNDRSQLATAIHNDIMDVEEIEEEHPTFGKFDKNKVECPICGKKFSKVSIERHAADCQPGNVEHTVVQLE